MGEPAVTEAPAEETEAMDVEEDGPLEDWTVKELKDECKTLGLSDKGKKAELINRIKDFRAASEAPAESVVEQTEEMDVEEDGPLEDWSVKELKEECKTLGLSDKGKKAELI